MRFVLFLVVVILLAFDYDARGPYSLVYLMYGAFTDAHNAIAWYFYKI